MKCPTSMGISLSSLSMSQSQCNIHVCEHFEHLELGINSMTDPFATNISLLQAFVYQLILFFSTSCNKLLLHKPSHCGMFMLLQAKMIKVWCLGMIKVQMMKAAGLVSFKICIFSPKHQADLKITIM